MTHFPVLVLTPRGPGWEYRKRTSEVVPSHDRPALIHVVVLGALIVMD